MSGGEVYITGAGWVTPLGTGLDEVYDAILAGTPAPVSEVRGPAGMRGHVGSRVPAGLVERMARHARLRRASDVSLYAASAVMDALRDAGVEDAKRVALIAGVSDGGVIYTRRFYDQVVKGEGGSPLLFPETVYNAPCSHVAALLGLDGATYTLVGDASVGLAALRMGAEVLATTDVEHCVVFGAEECDWVLCEAYHEWGLGRGRESGRGALMADGAAAVVLSREGRIRVRAEAGPVFRQGEAAGVLREIAGRMGVGDAGVVVSSANGTYGDVAEVGGVGGLEGARWIYPKRGVGEAFGASALMQVICGVMCVRRGETGRVVAPVVGLNYQVGVGVIGDC